MSPEQASGAAVDFRSDLFSLGAVLYFMATGHPPFRATGAIAVLQRLCHEKHRPAWQWNKDIPDELSEVIDRLLQKKPSRRPASAEQVQQELAELLSRLQQRGLTRRPFRPWSSRRMRRRVLAAIAAASACLAIATGAALWMRSPEVDWSAPAKQTVAPATIDGITASRMDAEFFTSLAEMQSSLGSAEAGGVFLRQGDGAWNEAMESLQRDLAALESNNSLPQ
jgi:serine/threonine protein kinase